MLNRRFPFVLMALAVVAGAFGAHMLKDLLSPKMMTAFQTGVLYQMIHGLGLLTLCAFQEKLSDQRSFIQIFNLLAWGTILFSGSIYLLAFNELYQWHLEKVLGPITPIGGLLMIAGWMRGAWSFGGKIVPLMVIFIASISSSQGQVALTNGGILINVSRGIIYASSQEDFASKAQDAAKMYQQEMQQFIK